MSGSPNSSTGTCPGCGAPLEFRVATAVVAVCGYCQQVVARGGVDVEDLGKTNTVLNVPSLLALNMEGRVKGHRFVVVGRTQLRHALGGTWNEWYAALDNGAWAWIAEHQGRLAVMGEVSAAQAPDIRTLEAAEPGSRWLSGRGEFIVAERGVAVVHAEEGELPWRAVPNSRRAYVDLSAAGGIVATLDFGTVAPAGSDDETPQGPRRFFVGNSTTAAALELVSATGEAGPARAPLGNGPRIEGSTLLSCPRCQAPLSLKRPEDTQTVVCGSCGSGLSVDENKQLGFLFAQKLTRKAQIPLGSRGRLDAQALRFGAPQDKKPVDVEVVAFVVRSVVEDGQTFTFEEYLLATPQDGFLWLVLSDGNWLLFRPIEAGEVKVRGTSATYRGRACHKESESNPRLEFVVGELFWRAKKGDQSRAVDYAGGAFRLTCETTESETNWTYGFGIARPDLQRVFGVKIAPSYAGAPYGGPDVDLGDAGIHPEVTPAQAILVVIFLVFFALVVVAGDCSGGGGYSGGGGRSGFSSGGGSSFGK